MTKAIVPVVAGAVLGASVVAILLRSGAVTEETNAQKRQHRRNQVKEPDPPPGCLFGADRAAARSRALNISTLVDMITLQM